MSTGNRARRVAVPVVAMTLLVSLSLWVWTSGVYYRRLPTPVCAVRLPFVLLQACASDEGVHLLAMKERGKQFPAIQFERATYLGNAGYLEGHFVNVLGLVIAVLPSEYCGGDYFVSAHVALVLPYWLLVAGSGWLLVVLTPVARWIAPYCRPSKLSGAAAVLVLVLFAVLNFIPSAWRPGAEIEPQTFEGWVTLTLEPHTAYSEIMLVYGYPFPCYRKPIINGQVVDFFYGAEIGWEPHLAMENFCVAAFAAFAVMLAIQRVRHVATHNAAE